MPSAPDRVGASLKHYVGYSFPLSGHDRTPAYIPDAMLREYFLPTFAAAVKAGGLTVMVNSAEVNGVPGHANGHLLKDVLRGELGFNGLVVSDWEDIKGLVRTHHVARDEKEATKMAVLAGIDMSMVPSDYSFADTAHAAGEREGACRCRASTRPSARVLALQDAPRAVRRSAARHEGGDAGRHLPRHARSRCRRRTNRSSCSRTSERAAAARRCHACSSPARPPTRCRRSTTAGRSPGRETRRRRTRGSSDGAQGARSEARRGAREATWPGRASTRRRISPRPSPRLATPMSSSLCLGEMAYAETPGNIDDLALPDAQLQARRRDRRDWQADRTRADRRPAAHRPPDRRSRGGDPAGAEPGPRRGTAIADVLNGDVNPSGRLPITYPRYANALIPYDHRAAEDVAASGSGGVKPQFAFGSGLSYTTFEDSGLTVGAGTDGQSGSSEIGVTVKNTGSRSGSDVVQVYVTPSHAELTTPAVRLKRFAKVTLESRREPPVALPSRSG